MYKVLVVEDEHLIRKGIIYTFDWTKRNCVVIGEAKDGEQGLEKIKKLQPDIVLLDINMPIMNGLEMLEAYRGDHIFSTIIVSAYDEFDLAKRAIVFGVSGYLIRPVEEEELERALEEAKIALDKNRLYRSRKEENTSLNLNIIPENLQCIISSTVSTLLEYIKENFSEKISIQDMVEELNLS